MTLIETVLVEQIAQLRMAADFNAQAAANAARDLARADELQAALDDYRATLPAPEIPDDEPAPEPAPETAEPADELPASGAPIYDELQAQLDA
ncbi:hypothetical protein JTF54_gp16 [Microbacterium phage Kaijohn]|uniref:Uncharacterized protein n=1 Tax=Microbacterium phage Kaijohn TaxID=2653750 RepID=A0A5Q2WI91_9CAUD|nr:hypothetical protein JTF54_gp16 [Microbacterium phage Kaijohn]QGH78536.1 hypothetical protein SEA_KAIJOHN_16 [Microbacterium phage Kaijohn]